MNKNERLDEVTEKCRATIAEPCTGKECVDAIKLAIQEYTSDLQQSLTKANEELVELRKDKKRLTALSKMVWETRWVSEEEDYQHLVGVAAEINSNSFTAIDSAITAQEKMK